jgi:hypothetical protein
MRTGLGAALLVINGTMPHNAACVTKRQSQPQRQDRLITISVIEPMSRK